MVTLHDDDFFTLTWEPERILLRMARKPRPFADLAEAERLYASLQKARARIPGVGIRLLIDQRQAIGNNDPAFEALLGRIIPTLTVGVSRVAVLVRSATGKLQVERLQRQRRRVAATNVFQDEAAALAFLDTAQPTARA